VDGMLQRFPENPVVLQDRGRRETTLACLPARLLRLGVVRLDRGRGELGQGNVPLWPLRSRARPRAMQRACRLVMSGGCAAVARATRGLTPLSPARPHPSRRGCH
jgi:hypothetical protein